jgi:hypothetical protein
LFTIIDIPTIRRKPFNGRPAPPFPRRSYRLPKITTSGRGALRQTLGLQVPLPSLLANTSAPGEIAIDAAQVRNQFAVLGLIAAISLS